MTAIKNPNIPAGVYPTKDTLITTIVDTDLIFVATTKEEVIASVTFDDNQGDPESDDGPEYVTVLHKNNTVSWVGAVKNAASYPYDQLMIYDITENDAITKRPPQSGSGSTHVDAKVVNKAVPDTDYTIRFWVSRRREGIHERRGFEIDPKLRVDPT